MFSFINRRAEPCLMVDAPALGIGALCGGFLLHALVLRFCPRKRTPER